jgi:asparagine synthase (glutamine-hydrolysing)
VIGLCGVLHTDGREVGPAELDALVAASPASGPEGLGRWRDGPAGLVKFHHATTPEAVGETQPLCDSATGRVLCFDGRLDNRDELLAGLKAGTGARLHRDSPDVDIVMALHTQWGDALLGRLVGDWVLVLWTPSERRLLCARSPAGFRPLLWTMHGGRFGFASQPRTLVDGLDLPRRLNEGLIAEYLAARFVSQDETFWQGLHRLPPGAALSLGNGRLQQWQWQGGPFEDFTRATEAVHVERFNQLFDQALASTQRSHGPVLAQLSGGLDSSSVVCRSVEMFRAGRLAQAPQAISVRYPGEPQDETPWSQAVEDHLGVTALVASPRPYPLDEARAWCARTLHLPLRPNVMPSVTGALRRSGSRVLLTGEGGDDWLNMAPAHWADLLASGQLRRLWSLGAELPFPAHLRKVLALGLGPWLSARRRQQLVQPNLLGFGEAMPNWIRSDFARRSQLTERWRAAALPVDLPTLAQQNRFGNYRFARRHVNVDNIYAYTDSLGIDVRHPFHDQRLTGFLMGAAGEMVTGKRLLREAMRGTLPEVVRARRDKANFVSSLVDLVETRVQQRPFCDMAPMQLGWVDPQPLVQSHAAMLAWRRAGCPGRPPPVNYGPAWFALATDLWLEHAFGL